MWCWHSDRVSCVNSEWSGIKFVNMFKTRFHSSDWPIKFRSSIIRQFHKRALHWLRYEKPNHTSQRLYNRIPVVYLCQPQWQNCRYWWYHKIRIKGINRNSWQNNHARPWVQAWTIESRSIPKSGFIHYRWFHRSSFEEKIKLHLHLVSCRPICQNTSSVRDM